MKKILGIFIVAALGFTACTAQNTKDKHSKTPVASATGAQPKPKVTSHVNRRYDENGNLIGYDSTYTWSYSSDGNTDGNVADSTMGIFTQQFGNGFSTFFHQGFGDAAFGDSLFYRNFPSHSDFIQKWNNHFFGANSMMLHIDSLQNSFFKRYAPTEDGPK